MGPPLKQVNGKFHTKSKENLYTYLKRVFRCNYGERQREIGIEILGQHIINLFPRYAVLCLVKNFQFFSDFPIYIVLRSAVGETHDLRSDL